MENQSWPSDVELPTNSGVPKTRHPALHAANATLESNIGTNALQDLKPIHQDARHAQRRMIHPAGASSSSTSFTLGILRISARASFHAL